METASGPYRFGSFTLDTAQRELRRDGAPVELGSRYFDALVLLVANAGELVGKDRFMDDVWRGVPVTDEALTQAIRTLRRALGDDAVAPRFIATVPKHGYRFVAPVTCGALPVGTRARGGRIAGAATLGGVVSGALAGLAYGLTGTSGGASAVLVLIALAAALGLLAGAGVGLGMALGMERGGGWRLPLGGAMGGLAVGALGHVLGRDGIAALTGAVLGPTTGVFEGLILGLASGLAGGHALSAGRWRSAYAGAVSGSLAGALIALSGGRLLGTSLRELEARFPGSNLDVDRAIHAIGHVPATMLEGAAFVAALALSISIARRT